MPTVQLKALLIAFAFVLTGFGAAVAAPDDEAFVQEKAKKALAILADDGLDQSAKTARFRTFVDEISDVRRVARFVLGKYARHAGQEKLDEFTAVFRRYSSGVYESQLGNYSGETVTVTGSQDRKPGDSLVSTVISGGQLRDPLEVHWRILTRKGRKVVLDVEILGIWLALQQRTELSSIIANHGGDIGAAIDVLNERIARQAAEKQQLATEASAPQSDDKAGATAEPAAADTGPH